VIALDGRLALSFTAGLLAAINPCGFVLLPTYLVYFLGMENLRPGAERASILRAIKVSLAVSAGFMSIFVVIGAITKLSTNWLVEKSQWVSLVIGIGLLVLGIAMLFGYRLPFTTPKLDVGERDRSVQSMYVFGVAYSVASIGCTIAPFSSVVLGTFSSKGVSTGITAVALYGVGMAIVVTGLTVTLAFANNAFLRILRRGMVWFEQLAGILLVLTGMYLCWYWYSSITDGTGGRVVAKATSWNDKLANFVQDHQTAVVWAGVIVIVAAVVTALTLQRNEPAS
jgi:cytochrome c-type biogenesis protein